MPRIRTLKPETASDRKLASVSRDARYTFVLLISQADDDGLLRAEPRQLLGALYPFDHDVDGSTLQVWLEELLERGFIRWRRTRDGVRVIEIINWSKHQIIKNRSKPFLLNHLEEPNNDDVGASVEPTESIRREAGGTGGAEPRVLSPEPRVLSPPNGAAKPHKRRPSRDPPRETWLTPFSDRWTAGTPPFGKMAAYLKPLVDEHGQPEVLTRWIRYLAATEPKFWSVHRFAETFNAWNADVPIDGIRDEPDIEYV